MSEKYLRDHERARQEAWMAAWCAVARSSNCVRVESPGNWANRCLADFDAKFPAPALGEE